MSQQNRGVLMQLFENSWKLLLLYSLLAVADAGAATIAAAESASPAQGFKLLGNGLAELQSLDDPAAAFSIGVAYSAQRFDVGISIRRGSETGLLTSGKQFGRFLLSPEARYLTGNTVMVDGGSCPIT